MNTKMKVSSEKLITFLATQCSCDVCGNSKIEWREIYYQENAKLIKSEKLHIGWCEGCKKYILK